MKETLLITGLTGRTGRCFVREITAHPVFFDRYDIVAVVREKSDTSAIDACPAGIRKAVGDLTDPYFCRSILTGTDILLHIAGIHYSVPLIPIAAESGVKRLIAVHTTGIYSKYKAAGEEYRIIDSACEKACRDHGVPLTILRPTMIYGGTDDCNMIRFIRMVDRLPFIPVVNHGNYTLQPVHRDDLACAYFETLFHSMQTEGKSYIISGDSPLLLRDILSMIAVNLNKTPRFLSIPFWFAYAAAWFLFCVTFGRTDVREKVQRLTEDRAFPHEQASADMGFTPRRFQDGIADEVRAYLRSDAK